MVKICIVSVLGGWQSAILGTGTTYSFGPVFNKVQDLWDWQRSNLQRE